MSILYTISQLNEFGYYLVYDYNFLNSTSLAQLNNIKSQCNSNSILCAGAGLINSSSILLMSCANCHAVLSETPLNQPVFVGSAYWYMTGNACFGFSPKSRVNQLNYDSFDLGSLERMSWSLTDSGGGRLGNIMSSTTLKNYKKYIFIN